MSDNAAIYYEDDAYKIDVPKLMGRQMAGAGFLHGFLRHARVDRLHVYAPSERAAHNFRATAAAYDKRPVRWIAPARVAQLAEPGCLSLPGPNLDEHAWQRLRHGERAWSLCGITHTTASHRVMDTFANLFTAPVRPWDAIVCTSRAVRDTVRTLLDSQFDYLRWRLGEAIRPELPQLPLIPLGVDCGRFEFDDGRRARARSRLGIADGDLVALFVGRLSFHAKAHPQPMYLALERAAKSVKASGARVHLIQTGWFANDFIEAAFRDGAAALCPSVNPIFVDGRNQEDALDTWAGADVFVSLSDNIQETFGLTPIEAMACGLPVVAPDWDGYRDTVRHGVDGFLVPTLIPPAPLGEDLAVRHETGVDNYDKYCGHTSQFVSVDTGGCALALEKLFKDPALRRRMGEAGRARAREVYDWRVIVGRHQALWAELAERRRADPDFSRVPTPAMRPARADPFALFENYATSVLGDEHRVRRIAGVTAEVLEQRRALAMNAFAAPVLPAAGLCARLLDALAPGKVRTVSALLADVAATSAPADTDPAASATPGAQAVTAPLAATAHRDAMLALVWMAKMHAIEIAPPNSGSQSGHNPAKP